MIFSNENIKDELQDIICTDEPFGKKSQIKTIHNFLRGNAQAGTGAQKQQYLKSEEAAALITFARQEGL